jgi:hypothetical protein
MKILALSAALVLAITTATTTAVLAAHEDPQPRLRRSKRQSPLHADPAGSWLSYLTATCPPGEFVKMYTLNYVVPPLGATSQGGFDQAAIWPGIEQHELDLLQPILQLYSNPTEFHYQYYSEHFSWTSDRNEDSPKYPTKPGNLLYSSMVYMPQSANTNPDGYMVCQQDKTSGSPRSCLFGRVQPHLLPYQFSRFYLVFEHHFNSCAQYPPSNMVKFFNVSTWCGKKDGPDRQLFLNWSVRTKNPECQMSGKVLGKTEFALTWNSSAKV